MRVLHANANQRCAVAGVCSRDGPAARPPIGGLTNDRRFLEAGKYRFENPQSFSCMARCKCVSVRMTQKCVCVVCTWYGIYYRRRRQFAVPCATCIIHTHTRTDGQPMILSSSSSSSSCVLSLAHGVLYTQQPMSITTLLVARTPYVMMCCLCVHFTCAVRHACECPPQHTCITNTNSLHRTTKKYKNVI